jgi:dihydropteroate synthase
MKGTVFYSKNTLNIKGKILDISSPIVMGILNVTPDSFYDGGAYADEKKIISRAEEIITQGGAIIDIGGYSTRPGANDISETDEIERIIPAVRAISKAFPEAILSIDTFRSEVAKRAINEGASMVNDISGGELDRKMFQTVGELKVPYILMHMKGTPQNMAKFASYENLIVELVDYFQKKIAKLNELGIYEIVIDPGFGFAKTREHNFELLEKLNYLKTLKMPILVGLSRKSMIYKTLNLGPENSLNGTTVLNTIALMNGAGIIRVHDVKECVEAVKLFKSVYLDKNRIS